MQPPFFLLCADFVENFFLSEGDAKAPFGGLWLKACFPLYAKENLCQTISVDGMHILLI